MVSGAGRGAGQQAALVCTQQKSGVTETSVCLKVCLIYDSAIQRSNPTGLEATRLVNTEFKTSAGAAQPSPSVWL